MSSKLKQLALKLYTYNDADRAWVLDNLDASQRVQIEQMLQELADKALPHDQMLIDSALSETYVSQQETEQLKHIAREHVELINNADIAQIHAILDREEAWIVALVLDCYHWKWKETFEKETNAHFKMQIKHYQMSDISVVKDEVKNTVLEIIATAIKQLDEGLDALAMHGDGIVFDNTIHVAKSYEQPQQRSWWRRLWQ